MNFARLLELDKAIVDRSATIPFDQLLMTPPKSLLTESEAAEYSNLMFALTVKVNEHVTDFRHGLIDALGLVTRIVGEVK